MTMITYFGYPGVIKKLPELERDVIVKAVCDWYGISLDRIMAKSRRGKIVEARQVAMYLLRRKTKMTVVQIGRFFKGMDHTTVTHSTQKIEDLMQTYPDFRFKMEWILNSI